MSKNIVKFGFVVILLAFLGSCKASQKAISKTEKKDSIVYVEKIKVDTLKFTETKTVTEPFYQTIKIPCDSLQYFNDFGNGKSNFSVSKENGKVIIKYKQNPLTEQYKELYKSQLRKTDSLKSIAKNTHFESKEVIKQTFWQSLISNFWFWLYCFVSFLWFFGFTPKFLLLKVLKL